MKRLLVLFLLFLSSCTFGGEIGGNLSVDTSADFSIGGFCGISTYGTCATDADCIPDGCSGQICRSTGEEMMVTTCEYLDCYDDTAYGVSCGCVESQCQWA